MGHSLCTLNCQTIISTVFSSSVALLMGVLWHLFNRIIGVIAKAWNDLFVRKITLFTICYCGRLNPIGIVVSWNFFFATIKFKVLPVMLPKL